MEVYKFQAIVFWPGQDSIRLSRSRFRKAVIFGNHRMLDFFCALSTDFDLRTPLRNGVNDHGLTNLIADLWRQRNDRYSQQRHLMTVHSPVKVEMSYIGG